LPRGAPQVGQGAKLILSSLGDANRIAVLQSLVIGPLDHLSVSCILVLENRQVVAFFSRLLVDAASAPIQLSDDNFSFGTACFVITLSITGFCYTPEPMDFYAVIGVVTCIGHLALGILAAVRSGRGRLAPILAVLCFVMFGWNFATLLYRFTAQPEWRYLDATISPWTTPVAFHFIMVFVGESKSRRWLLYAVYFVFMCLSLTSASAFFSEWATVFPGSVNWAIIHIVCILIPMTLAIAFLLRHLLHQIHPEEQMRTRLVFSALLIGIILASTELWADAGIPTPRLGPSATLVIAVLLSVITLRYRLLEHELSLLTAVYALAISFVAVLGGLALLRYLEADTAVIVMVAVIIAFLLVPLILKPVIAATAQRGQIERLATLGKLSAQMAHDLKNPLAALKGAVQFLQTEREQGRSIDQQDDFLNLLDSEIDRVNRMLDKYLRLGRIDPVRVSTDVNQLILKVFALERFRLPDNVTLHCQLAQDLTKISLDPDLLTTALENIVTNAQDAMPRGGELFISTKDTVLSSDQKCVILSIRDTGEGMNARQRERALDELFTTKATGSGLGLAFVKRIVEAHGGVVRLSSQEGKGTEVSLQFPLK
jgi:two-component system sensor histidine kinase HydH